MTMYKHHNPSNTSLSDNDNDDDNNNLSLTARPAQWLNRSNNLSPMSQLPPEILIHILKHLHSPKDLFSALRVSRAWCECAIELLWHKPSFAKAETLQKMMRVLTGPEHTQTFAYASFIRRLNFLTLASQLQDDLFSGLAHCDRLERLTLVNCDNLSANALIRVLPSCPNLVAIDLTGVINANDDAIIGLAQSAKRLQGINLAGCKHVTDVGIIALAGNCPLLRRVKLSGLELVTDKPISALAKRCPLLLEIDLNQCKSITDVAVRNIWTYSTHMREMRLSHCVELTDSSFPAPLKAESRDTNSRPVSNPFPPTRIHGSDPLPPLVINRSFEHLRMLDLTACALVTDDAIEGIISHASKIRNLVLSKCVLLTDKAVETICRLGRHLHYLHLGHAANITDRSVRTLARSCTRLRYVDFANCVHLTDMSVFELSALPKLRRIGLVRVNNLTDEAIYSLAERHATLERIHLSYCDRISVPAIHFLLQKLHKLTHLSLTGVPAFRQPELQQFCREPPKDFSATQQATFCVYSGKGVSQLRAFLTELFDHINEMNGTDDTEYEDDDYDGDGDGDGVNIDGENEMFREEEDIPEPSEYIEESDRDDELRPRPRFAGSGWPLGRRPVIYRSALVPQHELENRRSPGASSSNAANDELALGGAYWRARGYLNGIGNGNVSRDGNNARSLADLLPIVEPSHSPPPSDVASNRSVGTSHSNGATFFRTYHLNQGLMQNNAGGSSTLVGSEGAIGMARSNGTLTPDLNFAEIGHGRGVQVQPIQAGPSTGGGRRNTAQPKSFMSGNHGLVRQQEIQHDQVTGVAATASTSQQLQQLQNVVTQRGTYDHNRSRGESPVAWPYREPSSPVSAATARELQASVQSALGGLQPYAHHHHHHHHQIVSRRQPRTPPHTQLRVPVAGSEEASGNGSATPVTPSSPNPYGAGPSSVVHIQAQQEETRGRSVRRSIKNTLNVAEQYANTLLFGRTWSDDPTKDRENGAGSTTTSTGGSVVRPMP